MITEFIETSKQFSDSYYIDIIQSMSDMLNARLNQLERYRLISKYGGVYELDLEFGGDRAYIERDALRETGE